MAQSRYWVFTLNNPDDMLDFSTLKTCAYAIYSEEVGAEGTYHFQGYIQFTRAARLGALKKFMPRGHFEIMRGSIDQAVSYCRKTDDVSFIAGPYEYGTIIRQGQRSDLMACKDALDSGKKLDYLWDHQFSDMVRYHKAFEVYAQIKAPRRTEFHTCVVIYGLPGTGKTYWATEYFTDIYWTIRPNNQSFYFEAYNGEDCILIDDFYGYYPRDFMLRLCQPYECRLAYRGGERQCLARNVVITTNKHPSRWWKTPDISNFTRRVTHWLHFTAYKEYTVYKDYLSFYAATDPNAVHRGVQHAIGSQDNNRPVLIE